MKRALVVLATLLAVLAMGCIFDDNYYEVVNNTDEYLLSSTTVRECESLPSNHSELGRWAVIRPGERERLLTFGSDCVTIANLDETVIFTDRFSPDRVFTIAPDSSVEASEYTGYNARSFLRLLPIYVGIVLAIIGAITVIRWVIGLIRKQFSRRSGAEPGAPVAP